MAVPVPDLLTDSALSFSQRETRKKEACPGLRVRGRRLSVLCMCSASVEAPGNEPFRRSSSFGKEDGATGMAVDTRVLCTALINCNRYRATRCFDCHRCLRFEVWGVFVCLERRREEEDRGRAGRGGEATGALNPHSRFSSLLFVLLQLCLVLMLGGGRVLLRKKCSPSSPLLFHLLAARSPRVTVKRCPLLFARASFCFFVSEMSGEGGQVP